MQVCPGAMLRRLVPPSARPPSPRAPRPLQPFTHTSPLSLRPQQAEQESRSACSARPESPFRVQTSPENDGDRARSLSLGDCTSTEYGTSGRVQQQPQQQQQRPAAAAADRLKRSCLPSSSLLPSAAQLILECAQPERQLCGDGTRRGERTAAAAGGVTMLPPGAWNGSHLRTKHGTGACQSRE